MSKESKVLKIKRMRATILAAGLTAAMGGAGAAHATDAGTEVVVYSLQIGTDGFGPTGLTRLPNGTFYGWTFDGPTNTNQEFAGTTPVVATASVTVTSPPAPTAS